MPITQPVKQAATPVLLRPAIIELRYKDETEFSAAVLFYKNALKYSEVTTPEAGKTCVFTIGLSQDGKRKDMLLRLSNVNGDPGPKRTLVYWHVAGVTREDLATVGASLATATKEEGPDGYSYLVPPIPIASIPTTAPAPVRERSLLKYKSDYVGLTINPPVPTVTLLGDEATTFTKHVTTYSQHNIIGAEMANLIPWAVLSLLVILGVCLLSFWFGKQWEKSKNKMVRHVNVTMVPPAG